MKVTIWDNNGKTADRYTILNNETGDVWGCSENPSHPLGIGQYSHNVVEKRYGPNWDKPMPSKQLIYRACVEYRKHSKNLGKKIKFDTLPEKVQNYIKYITE